MMHEHARERQAGDGSAPGASSLLERLEENLRTGGSTLRGNQDTHVDSAAAEALSLLHRLFGELPPAASVVPRTLGRFVILGELGRGRFGIVCRARDASLNREVAVKIARDDIVANESLRQRFLREAKLAAALDHPGLVRILEVGEENGVPYFVMPICSGQTLDAWRGERRQDVSPDTAAQIVAQIAAAVGHAHAAGIVHRDLKPANVMVRPAPRAAGDDRELSIQVFDFGLGACADRGERETASGMVLGTLAYMSPEQAEGQSAAIGPSADVFALGVILYELLTGKLPFAADGLAAIVRGLQECAPVPPRSLRRECPRVLEAICLSCLRRDPTQRPADGNALARQLRQFLDGETPAAVARLAPLRRWRDGKRLLRGALLGLLGMTLLVGGWALSGSAPGDASEPGVGPVETAAAVEAGPARSIPLDVEREIAVQVLQMGGIVDLTIGNASRKIDGLADLPDQPFAISWIILPLCEEPVDPLLARLGPLQELVGIDLYSTPLTDRGAAALGELTTLHSVYVHNTAVSDVGLKAIAGLPRLRILVASDTKITDGGLAHLAGKVSLQRLDIRGTRITDRGLEHLTTAVFLSDLNVADTAVSDAGVASLQRLRHLEKLNIAGTRVSDEGLLRLAELPLKALTCSSEFIHPEGILRFTERNPDCHVTLK